MNIEEIQVGQIYFCRIELLIGASIKEPFAGNVEVLSVDRERNLCKVKSREGVLFYAGAEHFSIAVPPQQVYPRISELPAVPGIVLDTTRMDAAWRLSSADPEACFQDLLKPEFSSDGVGRNDTAIRLDYSREELIELCEKSIVPVLDWGGGSRSAHLRLAECWMLLKAGCRFRVLCDFLDGKSENDVTDQQTIWLRVRWPNQADLNWLGMGVDSEENVFFIPTPPALFLQKPMT
jgi:hypothetical protein